MKTKYFFLLFFISNLFLFACTISNKEDSKFNLDFEKVENGFPTGWVITNYSGFIDFDNNYTISLDSTNVQNGKYAASIEFTGDYPMAAILEHSLPENYGGGEMTLSGYIKTGNVTDGYAGLLIDSYPQVTYNDTSVRIAGTTDWKKYEMTVKLYPAITEKIIVGGYLSGKGKMWIDNLNIAIDGKEIQYLKPYQQKIFPAEKDKEFDNASNIVFPALTEEKINDLELLGKIWGFLKYYHPVIATGKYNWDYELFRMLPSYLKVSNTEQRDQLLLKWINHYGRIPTCKDCPTISTSAFIKPDLSWMNENNLNPKIKMVLKEIQLNRHLGYSYYVCLTAGVGNPIFSNENSYSDMTYPDTGFRLLALYRYWNMIQYFYPYKYLTDNEWNQVLKEYISRFIVAKNRLEYELVTTQLIGEVCDSHAELWGGDKIDSLRGNWQVPVRVQFIENKLVVTDYYLDTSYSAAEKLKVTGLRIGDIITHINGKPVDSIVDSIKEYYMASNEAARLRNIANDILRSTQYVAQINYLSSNQLKQKEIFLEGRSGVIKQIYKEDTTQCYKFINKEIGYVFLGRIKNEDIPIIKKEFINTKGIIIDIRGGSSASPYTLSSYFVSKSTPFATFTKGNIYNVGEFTFSDTCVITKSKKNYKGKLIVIVNEQTQSAAEFAAMAFKAGNNTTIIGSQTAGADGNVSEIFLPGGLYTWISGIGIYYPDGRETQRVGIVPDIEVKPTIKGIREGRDELLEKAIELINSGK